MNKKTQRSHSSSLEHSLRLPTTFAEGIERIKIFALQEFEREIAQKQLYYHTHEHVNNVQRRTKHIFQVVRPYWEIASSQHRPPINLPRMELLLTLCAFAHDMVQIFIPPTQPHTARKRQMGVSEMATIDQLLKYINELNQQLQTFEPDSPARLTNEDITIIREAIETTICAYDTTEQAIYQPKLYENNQSLSPVARILALADIGALGLDGIKVYNREGSQLFLEENLDVIPLLLDGTIHSLDSSNWQLYENIRQRLLSRCRFQVSFAKSRFTRFEREVADFPPEAISTLTHQVFKYLNSTIIQELERITPTDEDTSVEVLLQFFKFDQYIN